MANRLLPPVLTRRRIWLACTMAIVADAVQLLLGFAGWAGPDEAIDVVAMICLSAIIGFHPLFLPTFVAEFIPGVDMLPTWTGCTLFVIGLRRKQQSPPPVKPTPQPPRGSGPIIDI